jgi:hypothetical protein
VQKCHKLVEYGGEYRSKSAVRVLADEFLAPRNNGTMSPASAMTLNAWIEKCYLPFIQSHKEPSTYTGYKNSFNLHIRKHGDIPLRDVRTFEVERILAEIAHEFDTAPTTIQHVKALLSGAFRYAKRQGVLNTENPVRDAVLPKCKETEETYGSCRSRHPLSSLLPVLLGFVKANCAEGFGKIIRETRSASPSPCGASMSRARSPKPVRRRCR